MSCRTFRRARSFSATKKAFYPATRPLMLIDKA